MQILGHNLKISFQELGIEAELMVTALKNPYYKTLEVWELSDSEFDKLIQVEDEQWKSEYGWWRSGRCIYEGSATVEYKVNGKSMWGYEPDSNDCEIFEALVDSEYMSYTEWLSEVMNLTTEKNIAICAESLAQDNNMTLAEFISTYQV